MSILNNIRDYSPRKSALVWAFAGGIGATLLVGFAGFGWATAGSAEEMAENRAQSARAELATALCVQNFMAAPDANGRLAELRDTRTFQRDDYIADAGWATFADTNEPNSMAADECAAILMEMEVAEVSAMDTPTED